MGGSLEEGHRLDPVYTHTHIHTHPCVLTGPCPSFRGALGDSLRVMASTPFPVSCLKEITHRPSNSSSHTLTYTLTWPVGHLGKGTDGNSRVNTFFCRYLVFVCVAMFHTALSLTMCSLFTVLSIVYFQSRCCNFLIVNTLSFLCMFKEAPGSSLALLSPGLVSS